MSKAYKRIAMDLLAFGTGALIAAGLCRLLPPVLMLCALLLTGAVVFFVSRQQVTK